VFTAVALTSTTYAWFKINYQATVNHLQLRVTGGQGFKISVDDINYASDLKAEDIYNAIIVKYAPERFILHFDETLGNSVLYTTKQVEEVDENGNIVTIDDGSGNQIPNLIWTYNQPATQEEIDDAFRYIQLMPVTTQNGVDMEDLYEAKATAKSGRYIEFDVYFKTVNQTGYRKATVWDPDMLYYSWSTVSNAYVIASPTEADYTNFYTYQGQEIKYDIYLNGDTDYIDPISNKATSVSPTSFTSDYTRVSLSAGLETIIDGSPVHKNKGDTVDVYGANAIRLSITDNNKYDSSTGEGVLIYELDDYYNSSHNLGSYATKYSESYCEQNNVEGYSTDQEYIYNYSHSASYTYYSNLKGASNYESSSLFDKLYDYKNGIPSKTIKFDDLLRDGNNNYSNNKVITTLSSDSDTATRLTFRIWLEGWDADCFDGIAGNINALLSFIAIPQN
jgi:hypothetical protein